MHIFAVLLDLVCNMINHLLCKNNFGDLERLNEMLLETSHIFMNDH